MVFVEMASLINCSLIQLMNIRLTMVSIQCTIWLILIEYLIVTDTRVDYRLVLFTIHYSENISIQF